MFKRIKDALAVKAAREFEPPFTIEVTENFGRTGSPVMNGLKYRTTVTDANGKIVKTTYDITQKAAYKTGERYVARLLKKIADADAAAERLGVEK